MRTSTRVSGEGRSRKPFLRFVTIALLGSLGCSPTSPNGSSSGAASSGSSGSGAISGGSGATSTGSAAGSGAGDAGPGSAIPGQDPTTVTESGPPIQVLTAGPGVNTMMSSGDGVAADAVAVDGAGNVITVNGELEVLSTITTIVSKFDSTLKLLWSVDFSGLTMVQDANSLVWAGLAVDTATDAIYVGGSLNAKGVVQQILPDGTLGWSTTLTGSAGTTINTLVVAPNHTIYAAGVSSGQLPNQPAAASGGGFELHYAADGTLLQAVQSRALEPRQLFVDPNGNSVMDGLENQGLSGLDPSFSVRWKSTGISPGTVTTSPTESMFTYGTLVALPLLESIDFETGVAVWRRTFATQTATLNEGETWTGQFHHINPPFVAASTDSIYLTGNYQNTYQNGSSPPPATYPCYVMRLDSMGNQVWFKQFVGMFGQATMPYSFAPSSIAINGTKLVIGSPSVVFEINAIDGSGP